MSEREAELKDRQANAARKASAQITTLGATVSPKIAREARDKAHQAIDEMVECTDIRHRLLERVDPPS